MRINMLVIERTSFRTVKIYYSSGEELARKINDLCAKEIVEVKPATPDETTTKCCVSVYYEYYL